MSHGGKLNAVRAEARRPTGPSPWVSVSGFLAEKRAAAAVEFALIVPIMLMLYFLTMEFSQAIEVNKKVSRVASQVADLVTQQPTMTPGELRAIMEISGSTLQPYRRSSPIITVTAIQVSNESTPRARVVWSRRLDGDQFTIAEQPGTLADTPQSLVTPGAFFIRAEAALDYWPVAAWSDKGKQVLGISDIAFPINMGERYYLRPRMTEVISCAAC